MDRYYNDILVDKILVIMKRKDITKTALAKHIGMREQTLGNYLLKKRTFPYEVAMKIIMELDIDIYKLYNTSIEPLDEKLYEAYDEYRNKVDNLYKEKSNHNKK